ncbi:F-box only protein 16 [Polymixia lowei]
MPLAPRTSLSSKMQTKMSAWTPLNHQLSNNNVFVERRQLLAKWFDKWSDGQRRAVLQDFLSRCSVGQLRFLNQSVTRQLPLEAADFTCLLPRVLSLYLFSFLDPRSLCRCAQVSWRWKSIVELDQLWMTKCLRLGWCISYSPTAFEQAVWKRHYIRTVQELRIGKPQKPPSRQQRLVAPEVTVISSTSPDLSEPALLREVCSVAAPRHARSTSGRRSLESGAGKQPAGLPPWRDSDRHPKDTLRFNYLANLDPIEQAHQAQMQGRPAASATSNKGKPDNARTKTLSEANYKLRKAKSLMFLSLDLSSNRRPHHSPPPPPHHHQNQSQPDWAMCSPDYPITKETAKSLVRLARWNAGIRPGPVRSAVPRLSLEGQRALQRSHRSTPSTPLFESQPWTGPASN